jgi:CRISPR-associated endonuclease/helicase Cas3
VYVVNRRTVVDQATDDAKRLLARLYRSGQAEGLPWATEDAIKRLGLDFEPILATDHAIAVKALRTALQALCGAGEGIACQTAPLAVSTLRGELADNGEWKKNPARPAIVVGTIDMIGSKLLFSGYGDGRYGRAHHAGLIGQDALIVHDEAHLSPAFDVLLRSVVAEQTRSGDPRPIRVMSLSATTRVARSGDGRPESRFGVEEEDQRDAVVSQRLNALKLLSIVEAEKASVVAEIAQHARQLGERPARVLVYVRSPETAGKVAMAIRKSLGDDGTSRVQVLTGTIRGKERDELAKSDVFQSFSSNSDRSSPLSRSLFLVSTSAGEVGADLDADHMVCDLSTFDSMAQRLGRVNRMGGAGRVANVVVVADEVLDKEPLAEQRRRTLDLLMSLPVADRAADPKSAYDASPAAISSLMARTETQAAFTPSPTVQPVTDILLDQWSLTSIAGAMPGRPPVEPYLHGIADWEPSETHVAWRADIGPLSAAGGIDEHGEPRPCSSLDLEAVFDVFPLRSAEQLRDRTDRVQTGLLQIRKRLAGIATTEAQKDDAGLETDDGAQALAGGGDEEQGPESGALRLAKPQANPWVVLIRGSSMEWVRLADVAPDSSDRAERARRLLAFATVVLPAELGGIDEGMLNGERPAPANARSLDVAESGAPDRQRVWVRVSSDERRETPLVGRVTIDALVQHSIALVDSDAEDGASSLLEYRVARGTEREPGVRIGLDAHNSAVGAAAARLAAALDVPPDIGAAAALAGRFHDTGKGAGRVAWQRYAFNVPHRDHPGGEIAKSDRYGSWKMLGGYRHEFGSLLDAAIGPLGTKAPDEIALHPERDLILHLIAAHHGWARPHFERQHFDPGSPTHRRATATNEAAALESIQRFARLQRRFGRWGLAWLESLVRCADADASDVATAGGRTP